MPITHKPRKMIAKGATVPAPTGGLNAFDSLPAMPATDAILMRNLIPTAYGCTGRKGYKEHVTGLDGYVCTIMSWPALTGGGKTFAVDQTKIWDVTTSRHVNPGDPSIANSQNPYWQHVMTANAAGTHLIAFNGVDDGFWYSAAGYTPLTLGDGIVNGTWKNVDPKNLVQTVTHQKRLWAVQKDSTLGWYLPPEQVFGVATSFNFGALFTRGGFLQALATWSVDSGEGMDDKLVAISSRGEAAIYSGIDPSNPDTWTLEGVYYIGPTFTRRCWTKFGADLAILTQFGVTTMNAALSGEETVSANNLSRKVQKLISDLVIEGEARGGWQISTYPNQDLLIVNVPALSNSGNFQIVMNTITGAWTLFNGMAAMVWGLFGSSILFGSLGAVYRGLEGWRDNVNLLDEGGDAIKAEVQQAFSYFGGIGQNKHFKLMRPSFVFAGDFRFRAKANMDYVFGGTPPGAPSPLNHVAIWDEDVWDGGAVWYGGLQSGKVWVFIEGLGFAASIRMQIDYSAEVTWVSTDWVLEPGGIV